MGIEKRAGSVRVPHQEAYAIALNDDPTDVIDQCLLPLRIDDPKGQSSHLTGM